MNGWEGLLYKGLVRVEMGVEDEGSFSCLFVFFFLVFFPPSISENILLRNFDCVLFSHGHNSDIVCLSPDRLADLHLILTRSPSLVVVSSPCSYLVSCLPFVFCHLVETGAGLVRLAESRPRLLSWRGFI